MAPVWLSVPPLALAGLLAAVPTASAGTRPAGPAVVISHRVTGHAARPDFRLPRLADPEVPGATQDTSPNWAGWVDQANTNVQLRYVAATFTVPTVTCTGNDEDAYFWVGLDGWPSTNLTVEQAGIEVLCISTPSGNIPEYVSFYETAPKRPVSVDNVKPGDSISVDVYYDSDNNMYNLTLTDASAASADFNKPLPCPSGSTCHNSSAEVITEDPGGGPSDGVFLAKFTKVSFTSISVTSRDGTHGTLEGNSLWSAHEVTMEDSSGLMAQPSGRTDSNTAFTATWKGTG